MQFNLPPGSAGPVLVGVSGGPDSLCLLDGLARLGFPLIAAHFDHQLRPESGQDAESVRAQADRLGVRLVVGRQDVAAYARQEQRSLEEAARVLRYSFLFEQARQVSAQAVAVGHTADDQVETVLMHLLRGSGLAGLTGMPYRSLAHEWGADIPLVRPLLDFWRADTLAWCQENGLAPVFDPSNQDPVFFRNRLRTELIPSLETYNPQVRAALWRTARVLSGDAEVLQAAVQQAWQACLDPADDQPGVVVLRLGAFRALLPGLQRGVLRQAAAVLIPAGRDVDFAAVERGLAFARRSTPSGWVDLVDGIGLWVEGDRLLLSGPGPLAAGAAWPQLPEAARELPVPGSIDLPDGWRLDSQWLAWPGGASVPTDRPWEAWLDSAWLSSARPDIPNPGSTRPDVSPPESVPADHRLVVRRPRPGDRFQPLGMDGRSLKLSDFWINQKLPRRARAAWPLVTLGEHILWVPGYRPAHPARVTTDTRRVLHLRLYRRQD